MIKLDEIKLVEFFESAYREILKGIPGDESIHLMVSKHLSSNDACINKTGESLIKSHVMKTMTLGFVSNLGGLAFIPVSLAADVVSSYYFQIRLMASIAYLHGHDLQSPLVKDFIRNHFFEEKKWSKGLTLRGTKSLSGRILSRYGRKNCIKGLRLLPLASGLVGAGSNFYDCRKVGDLALSFFSSSHQQCA